MKKWIVMLLSALLMITPITGFAEESAEKVEISFSVGDDTLQINGTGVQVEKPYIAGVGVTLVPLRVITEAFGATVEWVAETQTILLSYPDVKIVLQINNPVAEVNGKAEALLYPPELTANGFTMVPLRFISETFGATVSFDEATSRITVLKESVSQEGSLVQGAIEESRVGDSYYKWSMDTPVGMEMIERSFDGIHTAFQKDENNTIEIIIMPTEKDYDFERDFSGIKQTLQNMTLVAADKDTSDANKKTMHFQAKDKSTFIDFWMYVTKDFTYSVAGSFDAADTETRTEGSRILKSFDLSFTNSDTYDLSNVKDGYRTFHAESMNFKINVPRNFYMSSSEDIENEFTFRSLDLDDDVSLISVGIYSASAVGSAKELAEKDYNHNKNLLNPELATFSAIKEQIYTNFKSFEYTNEIHCKSEDSYKRDVFFSLGSYVYNVSVTSKLPDPMAASTVNAILNSIVLERIDSDAVGILMRNDMETDGFYTVEGTKFTMQVPATYSEVSNTGDSVLLMDNRTATLMQIDVEYSDGAQFKDVMDFARSRERELKTDKEVTILKSTEQIKLDDARFSELLYVTETEDSKSYTREMIGMKNWQVLFVTVIYNELTYGKTLLKETDEMLKSIVIK